MHSSAWLDLREARQQAKQAAASGRVLVHLCNRRSGQQRRQRCLRSDLCAAPALEALPLPAFDAVTAWCRLTLSQAAPRSGLGGTVCAVREAVLLWLCSGSYHRGRSTTKVMLAPEEATRDARPWAPPAAVAGWSPARDGWQVIAACKHSQEKDQTATRQLADICNSVKECACYT